VAQRYRVQPPLAPRQKAIELVPADRASAEWVDIGRLAEIGAPKDVRLDLTLEHVLAIVGKRGSGKSFTLGSFLEGLCTTEKTTAINHISGQRAALLFDTLNIFQWMVAPVHEGAAESRQIQEQARLLKRWKLEPVSLAVDLWVPAGYESRVTSNARPFRIRTADMELADWAALLRVDAVQELLGQALSAVFDKVTQRGWKDEGGHDVAPVSDYAIADLIRCVREDPEIQTDFSPQTVRALRQRLTAYEASPLFGSTGTSLTELLQPGRLSVMLLSGVPDDVRLVAIFLTIRKLLFARAQASEAAKTIELGFAEDPDERARVERLIREAPPKTWVVVDEAQNVFPSERQTSASDILLRFVREGRNFGLSLGFTTQQPSAIDSRIMAQVDTIICHTLTVQKDLQNVLSNLKSREPTRVQLRGASLSVADAIRQLDVGQAFVSNTDAERSLFMDVRPRTSIHGGFES
jgi:DNA helicase HerA-like ATPase